MKRFIQRFVPMYHGFLNEIRKLVRGNPIVIDDASDKALVGLRVFGKSTQNGTPTPDAPVDIVSVDNPTVNVGGQTLSVPYTLHGIPITSGGNYTDANGQQWICDEVDFKRGVYVHRIKSSIVNGSSNIHKNENNENSWLYCYKTENNDIDTKICAICNRLHYIRMNESGKGSVGFNNASGNYGVIYINLSSYMVENTLVEFKRVVDEYPLTFLYALKVPIETPLTADQIEAYKALHTNKPNTTISNNQGAWMEVDYISN